MVEAWKTLLKASDSLNGSAGYLHDLVDLTRQVLQNNGDIYYNKMIAAFNAGNITEFEYVINKKTSFGWTLFFRKIATIFRGIFLDLESILATNEAFLLGSWLESAKSCANSSVVCFSLL